MTCIFSKICITSNDFKDFSHITYFNYNKKRNYKKTFIKLKKDLNILDD